MKNFRTVLDFAKSLWAPLGAGAVEIERAFKIAFIRFQLPRLFASAEFTDAKRDSVGGIIRFRLKAMIAGKLAGLPRREKFPSCR